MEVADFMIPVVLKNTVVFVLPLIGGQWLSDNVIGRPAASTPSGDTGRRHGIDSFIASKVIYQVLRH